MSDWAFLKRYAARIEADLQIGLLEDAGIPVLVRGPETGIFGPGFSGATTAGVTVFVPAERVDEAREVLGEDTSWDPDSGDAA